MKKLIWFLPLTIGMYACPFESKVPLASVPTEQVDTSLLGYWYGIIKDGSDAFGIEALDITKNSDSVYAITRYGKAVKGDMILPDTAYFTGYTSFIGEQRFMNVEGTVLVVTPRRKKQPLFEKRRIYYLSAMNIRNDTLSVKTITEDFLVRKQYKTPEELKLFVADLLSKEKNIYDDQYSISYKKIPRPGTNKPF